MEIPEHILGELKCSQCDLYLSQGPVYLQHEGDATCGRCFTPSPMHKATRNTHYEAAARLLRFPCKYQNLGCKETVPFTDEGHEMVHDSACEYRQYVCPVRGSALCDWLGHRAQLLLHCQEQHPSYVLNNPCSLMHNITKSYLHNFVLKAFGVLFLLHTKVCLTTSKIYYSVRLLGDSTKASDFTYKLQIKRNSEELTKKGYVEPQGNLVIQESTSLVLDINNLLGVLGGWDGTTFTVVVEQRSLGACAVCSANVTEMLYRDENGWRCKLCVPAKQACDNEDLGCTFQDIPDKCSKHEMYFCPLWTQCLICEEHVQRGMLATHYSAAHKNITYKSGATWVATRGERYSLVTFVAGTAVCYYWLDGEVFELSVYIPVKSQKLCEYRCVVCVTQSNTGFSRTHIPEVKYNTIDDWFIEVKNHDISSWNEKLDISVDIIKTKIY